MVEYAVMGGLVVAGLVVVVLFFGGTISQRFGSVDSAKVGSAGPAVETAADQGSTAQRSVKSGGNRADGWEASGGSQSSGGAAGDGHSAAGSEDGWRARKNSQGWRAAPESEAAGSRRDTENASHWWMLALVIIPVVIFAVVMLRRELREKRPTR